jgi:phenylacetate-CoA ligase
MSPWRERLYQHLPIFAQNAACSLHGRGQRRLRFGPEFHRLLDWLEESQWWSREQIARYQAQQLRQLLAHAYTNVPYYRRTFDRLGLKPADIESVEDLPKLPTLTKEDVRHHMDDLVSAGVARRELVFCHTSGSTGKSLQFYLEPRAVQFRWAVWWRHRRRFGIQFDAPYATFTGLAAVPLRQSKPPYWRENWGMHQTIFTMHHITPEKVVDVVRRLNQGGFTYYAGYPSVLAALALLMCEQHLEIARPPRIIFTGAETLYDEQRALLSRVFQCPVTDQYGFSEGCGNASRCPADVYHEDFEYGILECGDGERAEERGQRGKVIATGFAGHGMPFIRYEVGDVATWSSGGCTCGRHAKVITRIDGRVEDVVLTPEGSRITRFDYVFKDTHNVREAQVVQKALGSICLRIVRRPAFSTRDEERIREEVALRVSPALRVEFEYVDEIEREPGGKVRAVKSLIRVTSGGAE